MGRQNTIVFGSQVGTTSTPRNASSGPSGPSAPRAPLRAQTARQRYLNDAGPSSEGSWERMDPPSAGAPASKRFESQWFAATNPKLAPIGDEIFEERRGWRPPPPSRGLTFAAVSLLLVGVAAAGTFFFLGPDSNRAHNVTPVSTTTITNAEVPSAPAPAAAASPTVETVPTVTPAELPSAPTVVAAVNEPNKARAVAPAPAPAARVVKAPAKPRTTTKAPATTKRSTETSLPDLDRAAAAAGMTPSDDDAFATPGNDIPPATTGSETAPPAATSTGQPDETQTTGGASTPSTPAPSEVMPDLQIKR